MEGRYPSSLLVALINYVDPATEDKFNFWYNHFHIPDVTAVGVWGHGTRFVNTNPNLKPGDGNYLAIYESQVDDISKVKDETAGKEQKWRDQGRYDITNIRRMMVGYFRRTGGEFRAKNRPMTGISMVCTNCKDPKRDEEFNRWYEDVHIPDVLNTGLFHAAYRYETAGYIEGTTGPKYLAIYETDAADPAKASQELGKHIGEWAKQGRIINTIELVRSVTARRVWPAD